VEKIPKAANRHKIGIRSRDEVITKGHILKINHNILSELSGTKCDFSQKSIVCAGLLQD